MPRNKGTSKGPWRRRIGSRRITPSMDLRSLCRVIFVTALISLVCQPCSVTAGDIVHDDDSAPKKPGCENDFVLVSSRILFLSFYHFLFLCFLNLVCLNFWFWFLFSWIGSGKHLNFVSFRSSVQKKWNLEVLKWAFWMLIFYNLIS